MAKLHRYVLVEITSAGALMLTDEQRAMIRGAMQALQIPWDGVQPCELFQARPSLDGNKAIYELTYDDSVTPALAFAQVAAGLGINAQTLRAVISYQIFGDDLESSEAAAKAYICANIAEWETQDED